MEFYDFVKTFHIIGLAWGVGGATLSSFLNAKAEKDATLLPFMAKVMPTISKFIAAGLFLLIISGFTMGSLSSGSGEISSIFITKMIFIVFLVANGMNLSFRLIPKIEKNAPTDGVPSEEFLKAKKQLKISSKISLVLWYAILVFGVML